jgi:hypothetical protein
MAGDYETIYGFESDFSKLDYRKFFLTTSLKTLRTSKNIGNLITKTWPKMTEQECTFHELIIENRRSLKPTKI